MSVPRVRADPGPVAPQALDAASDWWGDLIQEDKRPSPLLDALLEGLAIYIVRSLSSRPPASNSIKD